MNIRCLAYRALERFRQSRIATHVVYGGMAVELRGAREIDGVITRAPSNETDGDCTFDVWAEGQTWHCECTPCDPAIQVFARGLQVGWHVRVSGIERYDPAHLNGPGHVEIHPVQTIVRVIRGQAG